MILLEDRFWTNFDCGPRMGVMALLAIAACIGLMLVLMLREKILSLGKAPAAKATPEDYGGRMGYWSFIGLLVLGLLLVALVVSLSPSVTRIVTDRTMLIETGCHRLTPYRKEVRLSSGQISYVDKGGEGDTRRFLQAEEGRQSIRLQLHIVRNHPVLIDIAPKVMEEYAEALRKRDRSLSPALQEFLAGKESQGTAMTATP